MTNCKGQNTWASTSSEPLKRKLEQAETYGQESGNRRPQNINRSLEAPDSDQDKDISDMEDEGEQDIEIDDKPTEANNEDKTYFSAPESKPAISTNSFNIYLNLPDIPFSIFIKMLGTTDLRRLSQVSSSWRKKITEIFLKNPANKKPLRARIRRAMGLWMLPSNEVITNAIWLSKYHYQ